MEESKDIKRVSQETDSDAKSEVQAAEKSENRSKARRDSLEELTEVILERAAAAPPTLRAMLAGTVELFVKDRPYRVNFDFAANPPKRIEKGAKEADCLIVIDERNLLKIDRGELNPQLALVTDKISVSGKAGLAVYFFNLLS